MPPTPALRTLCLNCNTRTARRHCFGMRAHNTNRSRAAATAAKQMDDFTPSVAGDVVAVQPTTTTASDDDDDDVNMNAHAFVFGGGDPLANFNDDAAVDNVYNEAGGVADMAKSDGDYNGDDEDNDDEYTNAANDILMLLNGEQDVMKFLSWAMQQLYPYQHFANKSSNGGAEYYHPSMFNWKKFNLSGHLEPPLLVEEPHYVIVRREQLEEDLQPGLRTANLQSTQRSSPYLSVFNFNHGPQYKDDPFIPPRGRKHNLPDLDALLNRYETFVPNRGKRDRIKDIFKYDDLFFPNRGKKQPKPPKAIALALNGQSQRHYDDETNELKGIGSANEGNSDYVGDRALLLDSQVDGNDDSNLTAPPAIDAMRRVLGGIMKSLRPHGLDTTWSGNEAGGDDGGTLKIRYDKNSDDNSNNYSDTIDSNLVADGDSNDDGEDDAAAIAIVGWPSENDDNAAALTSNQINENDQSAKLSMPQIGAINALTHVMIKRPPMIAAQPQHWRSTFKNLRTRRVAGIFAGATRVAANRLRSMPTVTQRQRQRHQLQRHIRQQLHYIQQEHARQLQQQDQYQPSKVTLRYFSRHLRSEQFQKQQQKKQAQRRTTWQMSLLPSNQVRTNSNDLDLLPWRQLKQMQKHRRNKNLLTVQHLPLTWLQHLPMEQEQTQSERLQQLQQQLQQNLFDRVDGVDAGRNPPETTDIDRIYLNI